ncbi:MAG: serine hydrolase domain-containing protein [Acidimicrobiales bacterium]
MIFEPSEGEPMTIDTAAPESVGMSSARLERIAPVMQRFVDSGTIAGATTLVARRGNVVHSAAFGHRDREAGVAMTDDTIFRIYSMTKPVVSTALMLLHEEGAFQLEHPVGRFLPAFMSTPVMAPDGTLVPQARPMEVRDLLTHTSGLTYDFMIDTPVAQMYRDARIMNDATHARRPRRRPRRDPAVIAARRSVALQRGDRRRCPPHRGPRRPAAWRLPA